MAGREWLLTDGLGGYAMGCDDGIRRRRYHGLLLVASPTDERRWMLVNGIEAWLETDSGKVPLTSHRYAPDVVHPDARPSEFTCDKHPAWTHRLGGGASIAFYVQNARKRVGTYLLWHVMGKLRARLRVRPLISGRDWHSLHHENGAFRFDPAVRDHTWEWRPYDGVPPVIARGHAQYEHAPVWYRRFLYTEESERGLDDTEDLASPGIFTWQLDDTNNGAQLLLTTSSEFLGDADRSFLPPTDEGGAEESYFARRGTRQTIIAGFPWFTDWGRDTFISIPGLCIEAGHLGRAETILRSWCDVLSDGMMPNLFPSGTAKPEYNSVDASLWFIVAVRELVDDAARRGQHFNAKPLTEACEAIVSAYSTGARFGIHLDSDGLLAAGEKGVALTWMDAVVDGAPVTPRIGKPVEVQALWINALSFAASWNDKWYAVAERAKLSFATRFMNQKRGYLYDVVDVDHVVGAVDDRMRPNQIFAIGGLPVSLIDGKRAVAIVDAVERELWTPVGLRTLSPNDPSYVGRADGPLRQRDRAYHQGTVWPWLTYAFLDAKARARPNVAPEARMAATKKQLLGLRAHVADAGIGHVSEIFDGDAPHEPRGCPFQAWSLAALLRIG